MSGNRALLDSNVIIDASKGIVNGEYITENYNEIFVSIITYIEVLGFNFNNKEEKDLVLNIFDNIPVVNLNIEIANLAIEYRQKRKIKLPDALILATAKYLDAELVTRNVSDFKNIDASVKIEEPKLK